MNDTKTLRVAHSRICDASSALTEAGSLILAGLEERNADINTIEELRWKVSTLEAELEEARKQPVALLPVMTDATTREMGTEWYKAEYTTADGERGRAANAVLARHFREAAEASAKPTLDVDRVAASLTETVLTVSHVNVGAAKLQAFLAADLRKHFTDAPAKPTLTVEEFSGGITITANSMQFGPDETLAAAVKRVERETRAKCAVWTRERAQREDPGSYLSMALEALALHMERGE